MLICIWFILSLGLYDLQELEKSYTLYDGWINLLEKIIDSFSGYWFLNLGNSSYGLHLAKHLDLELENQFKKNTPHFYCIIVKTLIGNTCLIEPSANNKQTSPNFLVGCHLSREISTQSQSLNTRYNNSLVNDLIFFFLK